MQQKFQEVSKQTPAYTSPRSKTSTTSLPNQETVKPLRISAQSTTIKPTHKRRLRRHWLLRREINTRPFLLTAAILILALGFMIGVALPAIAEWLGKPIPKDSEPLIVRIAPQLVLGFFGFLGGIITLCTFVQSYRQREREMRRQRDEFQKKQEQERLHFARTEQANLFKDIQDRFCNSDEKTRANAALRLGEMAEELLPGIPDGSPRNEKNYPYFIRAASALTIGLMTEDSANVRQAIREAISRMAKFSGASDQESEECLLYPLIDKTAQANRRTKESFIDSLGEYGAINDLTLEPTIERNTPPLAILVTLTAFTASQDATRTCLKNLIQTDRYAAQSLVYQARREAAESSPDAKKEQQIADAALLIKLERNATRLRDTRDTLATCLKVLSRPHELKELKSQEQLVYFFRDKRGMSGNQLWERNPQVNLEGCFLSGADLQKTNLEGNRLNEVNLEGANLKQARLESAYLRGSHLEWSNLRHAHLEGAYLNWIYLCHADLQRAHLQDADLWYAHMENANIRGANIVGAEFCEIHITDANLYNVTYIRHDFNGSVEKADFTNTKWWEADITNPYTGEEDQWSKQFRQWIQMGLAKSDFSQGEIQSLKQDDLAEIVE